jgi:hypothetical protein
MRMSLSHEFKMNAAGTKLLLRNGQEATSTVPRSPSTSRAGDERRGTTNPNKTFQDQPIPADIYGACPSRS